MNGDRLLSCLAAALLAGLAANAAMVRTNDVCYLEGLVLGCYPDDLHLNAGERQ